VAAASNISALWILIANGWMQHPVGYVMRNGRAELDDFSAVVFNKFAILEFLHTVPAGFILAGFFVMGISAYHLLKKQQIDFFTRSFQIALVFSLISSIWVAIEGDQHAVHVTQVQPTKLAAMESHWETTKAAPLVLFAIPDEKNERNLVEFGKLTGLLSLLGYHDFNAEVKGLKDFPAADRPPVLLTFLSFRTMVALGTLFPLLTLIGLFLRQRLVENRWYLKIMMVAIPLPYIAMEAGWMLAEVGRQPWIVYGLMRTANAASPVAGSQVISSLAAFILVYGLLGIVGFFLIANFAIKGPHPAKSAAHARR
jgi:cytochrome bd ubiquinol oxidase subunit I